MSSFFYKLISIDRIIQNVRFIFRLVNITSITEYMHVLKLRHALSMKRYRDALSFITNRCQAESYFAVNVSVFTENRARTTFSKN